LHHEVPESRRIGKFLCAGRLDSWQVTENATLQALRLLSRVCTSAAILVMRQVSDVRSIPRLAILFSAQLPCCLLASLLLWRWREV
jgi:hypothetical protein